MHIRKMKVSDIPQMIKLWKKANLPLDSLTSETKEAELVIKLNPISCLVALDEGKLIGSIMGTFNGRRAWIYHLAISLEYQNKGLGTALLERAEKTLKKRGAAKILIWADTSHALSFYKKNGFETFRNKGKILRKTL